MRKFKLLLLLLSLFAVFTSVSCSFDFNTITRIDIDASTIPSEVNVGELNLNDLKLIVTYSNNTTRIASIYASMVSQEDREKLSSVGTHTITVNYQGLSTSFIVNVVDTTVVPITLVSIEVTKQPDKITYFVGETFDQVGLVVTATYSNQTTKEITDYTISPLTPLQLTDTVITVTYEDKTATIAVTVSQPKLLVSIEVTKQPDKTNYIVGDTFDKTGLIITATYLDTTTRKVTNYTLSPDIFTPLKLTDTVITVTYKDKTTTIPITVIESIDLVSIAVTKQPDKTNYIAGETFDRAGLVVTATYSNQTTKAITDFSFSPSGNLTEKDTTITITYLTCSTTVDILVTPVILNQIAVDVTSMTSQFSIGEVVDFTNAKLLLTYNNGDIKAIPLTANMVTGLDTSKTGAFSFTVTYHGLTCNFNYTVVSTKLESIQVVKGSIPSNYYVGDILNLTNAKLLLTNSDGSTQTIAITQSMISGFDSSATSSGKFTITFRDKSCLHDYKILGLNPDKLASQYGYNDLLLRSNGRNRQLLYNEIAKKAKDFCYKDIDITGSLDIFVLNFVAYGLTEDEAIETFITFQFDNPYYYWIDWISSTSMNIYISIESEYSLASVRKTCNDAIEVMINEYIALVANITSDVGKAVLVGDRIIATIDYTYDQNGKPSLEEFAHDVTGIALKKGGVCEAYAVTYSLILNYLEVPNIYVVGVTGTNGGHAWNYIQVDGKWYGVDITWNDQGANKETIYDYFGQGEQFLNEHQFFTPEHIGHSVAYFMYAVPNLAVDDLTIFKYYEGDKLLGIDSNLEKVLSTFGQGDYTIDYCYKYSTETRTTQTGVTNISGGNITIVKTSKTFYELYLKLTKDIALNANLTFSNLSVSGNNTINVSAGKTLTLNRVNEFHPNISGEGEVVVVNFTQTFIYGKTYDINTLRLNGSIHIPTKETITSFNVKNLYLTDSTKMNFVINGKFAHTLTIANVYGDIKPLTIYVEYVIKDIFPTLKVDNIAKGSIKVYVSGTSNGIASGLFGIDYTGNIINIGNGELGKNVEIFASAPLIDAINNIVTIRCVKDANGNVKFKS
ncbi:MAG: bacterial Ig-like domain-containing protein [Clostridia bacterium]